MAGSSHDFGVAMGMTVDRWIAAIALVACTHGSNGAGNDEDPIVIGLDRSECYGSCPAYSLAIHASGTVEYIGMASVKTTGLARGFLTAATMRTLAAEFDTAGFAALPEDLGRRRRARGPDRALGRHARRLSVASAKHRDAPARP